MKLSIAGGFYREICREPSWDDLFGPGGRAAAALSGRETSIELHCYAAENQESSLRFLAATFGIDVRSTKTDQGISFAYLHFLSVPQISPRLAQIQSQQPLQVSGDAILRFGFLEGEALVHGSRVVYDPQDAFAPKKFRDNGSSAKELAIVTNVAEARLLTGLTRPEEMAIKLLSSEHAEVVVTKLGSGGALVTTSSGQERIPAYPTPSVWKIGSGDVFSAEFAYAWAVEQMTPGEAAYQASLQTAYYSEYPVLPIRPHIKAEELPKLITPSFPSAQSRKFDVYLAGPFFNLAQQWQIEETYFLLQHFGLKVFSPFHAIGDGPANVVAKADIEGLENSRFVFACLDGFDPGTVFEVGYANSKGIPVLGYGRDLPESDLVMFHGLGCEIISDFTSAIYRASWWTSQK